jgi:Winged helix DNA-binding domain
LVSLLPAMAIPSITRENVLAFRQRATFLHRRLPPGRLVDAAFAGLQDSAPRSAVLALHARVQDVSPSAWKDPRFVQVWGPRGAVYVVPGRDVAVFTLGRSPRNPVLAAAVKVAAEKAKRVFRNRQAQPERVLSDRAAGVNFRELRIASMTGAVRIEWDGATTSWRLVEAPTEAAERARLELARRFLRSVGPSTPLEFAWWSGGWAGSYGASTRGELSDAQQTFRSLEKELTEVEVAGRKQWALRTDRVKLERAVSVETVRLLPAGDPFLASADRTLLVPQPRFRSELWPNSVWPGALLVNGDLVGTWRRQVGRVTVRAWRPLEPEVKEAVEEEVSRMPIESATKEVRWSTGEGSL